MKFKHLLKTTALTLLLIIAGKVGWGQTTIAAWTYPTTTGNVTTNLSAECGTMSGSSIVYADGTNGSDNWIGTTGSIVYFGGYIPSSALCSVTTATGALSLANTGSAFNSKSIVFKLSMTGYEKLQLSYDTRGTATGFTTQEWLYSTDGSSFTTFSTITGRNVTTFSSQSVDFSSITALNNQATVYIKLIVSGATTATGNNRLDNVNFKASIPDATPPTLSSTTPADEATGIALNLSSLGLTFSENIAKGTGKIFVKKVSDDFEIEAIDVTTSAVAISNSTATVTLTQTLALNTGYYINIDAGAFKDLANNNFAGINDKTTWNFTSRLASTAATVTSGDYTVTDATWTISNIPSGVSKATFEGKLTPVAGATIATFEANGTTPATGIVLNGYKLKVTAEDGTTINTYTLVVTPALTAATGTNIVDNSFDITFTADAAWETAITAVKDGTTALTVTTDYNVASGKITLIPTATNSLRLSGTRTITVIATGYADATVTQEIKHGLISSSKTTISTDKALKFGETSTVTLTAKDQYENPISGYVFKYDVSITNTTATTTEQYTIDGTARTASISDLDVTTVTDASGVATFTIIVPDPVDGDDGISVQVQLNDGTTNLGSALSYFAPTAPTLSISATPALSELNLNGATVNITLQNETFIAGSLTSTNYTLHNAPANVSISDVTKNSPTTATLTLAFDGTDFDSDSTHFNITIAGAELTLNNPLTSNDLTITAVNLATVATNAAITTNGLTTATWGGNVTADGGATVTEKGICWNTTGTPTLSDSKTTEGSGIGAITGNMTGLSTATKYYVRAYATNYDGTNYGSEYNFTTFASASTFTASYPKSANITLTGFDVVVNTSAAGKVYFLRLASGATAPTSATVKSTGTEITVAAASTDYTATITGLTQYTTYDVYFVTENSDGVLMDTPVLLSVTTLNTPAPSFTATYPKSASITVSGFNVVVNTDAVGKVYFLRLASGATAPTSADVKSTGTAINIVAASTDYSSTVTGLTSGTTYDVYFVTENNNATVLSATPVKLSVTTTSVPTTTIHDIQYTTDASGDSPVVNQTVTTSGIVTAIKYSAAQVQQGFYLQNGSGAWNGVYIYTATPVVAVGDNVTVTGTIVEFNKTTEMTPVTSSNIVSSNNTLPTPVALTTLAANNESYEGVLIKVSGATCTGSPATGTFVVNDGSGDLTVYKSLFQTLALTTNSKYNVTGVLVDYYTTSHLYELYPRGAADISDITGIDDNQNSNLSIYPNPFDNEIRFEGSQSVKRVVITSITGQVLKNVEIGQVNFVNTQDLPRGMYLVTFMNSKGEKTTQKMVKQ